MSMTNLTEEEFRTLVASFDGNGKAVAAHLGVTPSAVSVRLRVKNASWWASYKENKRKKAAAVQEEKVQEFRRIAVKHKGDLVEIAKELNVKPLTVNAKLASPIHAQWWKTYKNSKQNALRQTKNDNYAELATKLIIAVQSKDCLGTAFANGCKPEKLCGLCELKKERDSYKNALSTAVETLQNAVPSN